MGTQMNCGSDPGEEMAQEPDVHMYAGGPPSTPHKWWGSKLFRLLLSSLKCWGCTTRNLVLKAGSQVPLVELAAVPKEPRHPIPLGNPNRRPSGSHPWAIYPVLTGSFKNLEDDSV